MQRTISSDLLFSHDDSEGVNNDKNNKNNTNNNNTAATSIKDMKFNFSTQELFEAVYEARKTSIMRSLLQQVDNSQLQKKVAKLLEGALETAKHAGEVSLDSTDLPVGRCFEALEKALYLHLNRSQIMFIISWAECYDREGTALEVNRFAEHASTIIAKLNGSEMIATRAQVLVKGAIDDKKALNGLREKDVARQLDMAFKRIVATLGMSKAKHSESSSDDDEEGDENKAKDGKEEHHHVHNTNSSGNGNIVPGDQVIVALQSIPKVKLSEREIATIMAACSISSESPAVDWTAALLSLVDAIVTLCRERMINRRVSLYVTANSNANMAVGSAAKAALEESLRQLKQLAEKLLNFVKIAMSGNGEELIIQLPTDKMQRKASQLLIEEAYSAVHQEVVQLYRGALFMKTETQSLIALPPVKTLLPRRQSAGRDMLTGSNSGTPSAAAGASNNTSMVSMNMSMSGANPLLGSAGLSVNTSAGRPVSAQQQEGGMSNPERATTPNQSSSSYSMQPTPVPIASQPARLVESKFGRMAVMLQVMAVEDHRLFSGSAQLVAQVLSLDASLLLSEPLPLRLPSIGAVDREAAEQFVANIVEQIYLVKEPGAEKWAIRVVDEES